MCVIVLEQGVIHMASRRFAQIMGGFFMLVGILGFFPGFSSPPHSDAVPDLTMTAWYGSLFGLFPVNGIHNWIHIGVGLAGLYSFRNVSMARHFARGLTWFYAILAVMGVIPSLNMAFGIMPLHGWNVWLHGSTALLASYFGYGRRSRAEEVTARYAEPLHLVSRL